MSQETIDFVEDIVKTILSRWESLPVHLRDKMRDELMSVFISFVGAGDNKTLKDKLGLPHSINLRPLLRLNTVN